MENNYKQLELLDEMSFLESKKESYFERLIRLLNVSDTRAGWPDEFGIALKKSVKKNIHKPIKTLSLFSGGGGLDIAFHDAGFDIVQMIELDNRFHQTLYSNASAEGYFDDTEAICIDIRDYDPPENLEVDLIIGGPPCQTFSAAGRRASGVLGTDDPRGTLFEEYVRILKKLKPKAFVFENVYGILGAQNGEPWKEIVSAFENVGYNLSYRILDTADYGVPQHRERLIIVGVKNGNYLFPRPSHGPDSQDDRNYYLPEIAVEGVVGDKPSIESGKYTELLRKIPPGLNYSYFTEKMGHPNPVFAWRSKFSDFLYKADPKMPVRTLKAQGGKYTGPFHWDSRPFSLEELKRLQTFPDKYAFSGGKQVVTMQIGNSVPPQFGRILAISILDQIFNIPLPFMIDYLKPNEELGFRKRKTRLTKIYQDKAKEAILRLDNVADNVNNLSSSFEYNQINNAFISDKFLLKLENNNTKLEKCNFVYRILIVNEKLTIEVSNDKMKMEKVKDLQISIEPRKEWNLPFKEIILGITGSSKHLYTASWKVLENYLATNNIRADLVQLNGYYQYPSLIRFKKIKWSENFGGVEHFTTIAQILEGKGVNELLTIRELGFEWGISEDKVKSILLELKSLGYEVRSEYTNSQIPSGKVLIPYSFPTLSHQSVQLSKQLFPILNT